MRRTPQEIVELVVFGLIALLLGTGVLWLLGVIFGFVGTLLGWLAALLWGIVSFLVPVAIVAGVIVLIVRLVQGKPVPGVSVRGDAPTVDATPAAPAQDVDRDRAAESTAEGMPPAPPATPPVAPEAPTDGTEPAADEVPPAPEDEARRHDD